MTAPASATPADRALSAFRRLVSSVFPGFVYALVHEYAVAESDGLTFSGNPTDPTFSPALPVGVPYSPSLAGSSCVVPVGTLAYVGFANADPGKPYLVRFAGGPPTSVTIDAKQATVSGSTVPGVVNVGPSADAVNAGTAYGYALRDGDVVTFNGFTGPIVFSVAGAPGGPTPGIGQSKVKL